jgi:GST-like protein
MIDVYAWRTSNGLRATVALAESGLPHRVIPVDLGSKANRADDYLRLNPAGQIPTLVDPDGPGGKPVVLGQSGAIVLYACRKAGRYIPEDPVAYAQAMQWFLQASSDIAGTSAALNQVENVSPEKVPGHIALFQQRLVRYFGVVDKHLQSHDYLAGEPSFADFMLYPNYALKQSVVADAGLTALVAWGERMAQRPGVREGMRLFTEAQPAR